MEQYQCRIVDLGYYNNEKSILVKVNDDDEIEISTEVDGINVRASSEYYFDAYQKFRDELLEMGYGLQCNGSRINAIQSPMMGYSEKIYLVELGKQALMENVVSIWEYANLKEFLNSEEQLKFAQQWYDSI